MAKKAKQGFPEVLYTRMDDVANLNNFPDAESAVLDSSGIGPVIIGVYKLVKVQEMSVHLVVDSADVRDEELAKTLPE
jgi:hypothetical protein